MRVCVCVCVIGRSMAIEVIKLGLFYFALLFRVLSPLLYSPLRYWVKARALLPLAKFRRDDASPREVIFPLRLPEAQVDLRKQIFAQMPIALREARRREGIVARDFRD